MRDVARSEAGTTARERALIESRNGGLFETSGVVAKEIPSSINRDKTEHGRRVVMARFMYDQK